MTLTLLIENYRILDDGGPASIVIPESGLQVGRRAGMGWVLPDASRHISGHHFDVFYRDGQWWLRDQSTNGTFLHGMRHRLDGPHKLEHGERFQVGQYIIVALMDAPPMVGGLNPGSLPSYDRPVFTREHDEDPWSVGAGDQGLAPINPLPPVGHAAQDDFQREFMAFPHHDPVPPPVVTPAPMPAPVSLPLSPQPEGAAIAPPPPVSIPPAAPAPHEGAGGGEAFARAFCEGAGLPPEWASKMPPEDLARLLGEAMRAATGEVMLALRDRASAKQFVRVGERTMRGASDNNPLKFLPDADQALEAMFLRPRAGFMTGPEGFADALRDLRQHQAALFAALQPALMTLLGDLAPEAIEAGTEAGRFGANRKSRAWEAFVARWDAKVAPHENGMLDEFIQHFAAAYRDALAHGPGRSGSL